MSNRVVASYENREADHCVDIFVRPDGSHGFEEWRREPEDPGKWYRARYHDAAVYASVLEAIEDARRKVVWFGELPMPDISKL